MLLQEHVNKVTITHIILMSLVLHSFVIAHPQFLEIWDESILLQYTRDFLNGEDHTPYQLPGSKLFVAASITLLGDHWFSWRVPSVIFGLLTILVFYKIATHFTSEKNALLAATLLAFDTIFFVHSSLFLRDVPMMFFGFLGFYLYLKKRFYLAPICIAFAIFIKETAILVFVLIIIYHVVTTKPWNFNLGNIKTAGLFLIILSASFLFPLWIYDVIFHPVVYNPVIPTEVLPDGREVPISYPRSVLMNERGYETQVAVGQITNPFEHLGIFWKSDYIKADIFNVKNWGGANSSNFAWNWILPLLPEKSGNNLGYVKEIPFEDTQQGKPNKGKILGVQWMGLPNLSLWPIGFWGTMCFLGYSAIKARNKTAIFLGTGISIMFIPYLLLSIIGRIVFPYYFILSIPFITLGIISALDLIKNNQLRILSKLVTLAIVVAWFVWFYPLQVI